MTIATRKASKDTSYAYRYASRSVRDQRSIRKVKISLIGFLHLYLAAQTPAIRNIRRRALLSGIIYYRRLTTFVVPARTNRHGRRTVTSRTIDSFTEAQCWQNFRTRKEDLPKLLIAFKLDPEEGNLVVFNNGCRFTKEEILLIGLHRYSVAGSLQQSMGATYGIDFSMLSRAITYFNKHMLTNFGHLLTDNLEFWKPYMGAYSECIRKKLEQVGDIRYAPGTMRVFGFHDDTVLATCRPGGGPAVGGDRHDNFIQMAFYNGWKKHHGHKYQSVELPNGMVADMYGPVSFRHNDVKVLRDSELNERLAALQANEVLQYASYGDGIFPIKSHTIGKHVGETTPEERYENRMMSKIRIANEWDYGITANNYPFVKHRAAQKIRHNKLCTKFYFIATLLRNAHVCLYESETSSYFDCPAPSLFDYFEVNID